MTEEIALIIREAVPEDAQNVLALMQKVGQETNFLVMAEKG